LNKNKKTQKKKNRLGYKNKQNLQQSRRKKYNLRKK